MAKEENYNISDTGNWNVASKFSELKIMRPLFLCDEYAEIAEFGTSSLIAELENPYPDDMLKIKGFQRLINKLILLIDNAIFAIKSSKSDVESLKTYKDQFKTIKKIIPSFTKTSFNQRLHTSNIKLNHEEYEKALEIVLQIKSEINTPLNRNHLIFVDKEEVDVKELKQKIIDDVTSRG
jgi:hypothetical protein